MKIGCMFANVGPFGLPEHLRRLAQIAEESGIESLWTVEHVVVPKGYESEYPYSPSGKMPGPEESPIPDPLLPLAFAAAVTEKLRLGTGVMILPQRHPAYVAKEMATLDVLSGGRAILGVGIGWLKEEFDTVDVPFKERAPRTEESIRAIRSLWEKPQPFQGRFYSWDTVESNPKPVQKPGVPILVGGHVEGAARRAARVGDGFFPIGKDLSHLKSLLEAAKDECQKQGRDPESLSLTVGAFENDDDSLRAYRDLGAERICIGPPGFDEASLRKGFDEIRERVAKL